MLLLYGHLAFTTLGNSILDVSLPAYLNAGVELLRQLRHCAPICPAAPSCAETEICAIIVHLEHTTPNLAEFRRLPGNTALVALAFRSAGFPIDHPFKRERQQYIYPIYLSDFFVQSFSQVAFDFYVRGNFC